MFSFLKRSSLFLLILSLGFSFSQQQTPCSSPEYRQFDFWVGEWEVFTNTNGQPGDPAGSSKIELILNNCALQESYSGQANGGVTGHSYNTYSAQDGLWHQGYVDAFGTWLHLEGSFENGVMDLRRQYPSQQNPGATVIERITWTLMDANPDQVRQHWQWSIDGETWNTIFDGIYKRKRE